MAEARQLSVYILPGFAEGAWHVRQLLPALQQVGFAAASDAARADVIIAHSASCFDLPPTTDGQQVVLIGPPFYPGKPLLTAFLQKGHRDFLACARRRRLGYWARKTAWNLWNGFGNPGRSARLFRASLRHEFYRALHAQRTIIIRNDHDSFCTPEIARLLAAKGSFQFAAFPGEHDDCWLDTDAHAKFVASLLET